MKLTAQIKLVPTPHQADLLKHTLEAANAACNTISDYAWTNSVFSKFPLQKALYYDLRAHFSLTAQLVVRCLGKVADSYKSDKTAKHSFKEHGSVAYDNRILAYRQKTETVSIWLLGGRQTMPYQCGDRQRELLKHQKDESDLWHTGAAFYLLATCEIEEPKPAKVYFFLIV